MGRGNAWTMWEGCCDQSEHSARRSIVLKMEDVYFSETSVRNYDPACCKNLVGQFFQYDKQTGLHN